MTETKKAWIVLYGDKRHATVWASSRDEARALWISAGRPNPTGIVSK